MSVLNQQEEFHHRIRRSICYRLVILSKGGIQRARRILAQLPSRRLLGGESYTETHVFTRYARRIAMM